jgi:hypothetical protein
MKYALLMCGQPRTMEFCFPSLKKHILDVYAPDVFICSDDQGQHMMGLFQPKKMDISSQETILNAAEKLREKHLPELLPIPVLSAGWKFYRCFQLMQEYAEQNKLQYDCVIVCRFDLKILSIEPIAEIEENAIYVPKVDGYPEVPQYILDIYPESFQNHLHWGGYSTHLCWMTPSVAEKISQIYFDDVDNNRLATAAKAEWGQNPEHVLKWFCEQNSITPKYYDGEMMLIRGDSNCPMAFNWQPLSKYPRFLKG